MISAASRVAQRARPGTLFGLVLAASAVASCSSKSINPNADASADGTTDATDTSPSCGVPTSFAWSSTGVLLSPMSDATHSLAAIKDPSVVYFDNKWHSFASSVTAAGTYNMVYMTFPDWDHTADATFYYMDQTPGFGGYKAAPQVFFFAPQNASCFLFFSDDAGHWYRSQTTVDQFPDGFADPVVVMSDPVASRLFEASNVYKMKDTGKYLALVEAYDPTSAYHRYFRSWTADTLDGAWTPLQDTYAAPFASTANVTFTEQPPWTADISHGEMIRDGYDQLLEIDTCHLQYLYQGVDPTMTGLQYNSLPWRLGLLTATP